MRKIKKVIGFTSQKPLTKKQIARLQNALNALEDVFDWKATGDEDYWFRVYENLTLVIDTASGIE